MKSNNNLYKNIELKIIRFFDENPSSVDTARGIAAWIGEDIEDVKICLEELHNKGFVIAHKTHFATGYAYTQDKKILQIIKKKFLHKKNS